MPYIGQPPVTGDTTSSFRLLDNIASFTLTFDGSSAEVVSTANDTLTFSNHRFVTAQRVTYTHGGGTAIGGLTSGTAYYIIKVDQNTIKLATSAANANNNSAIDLTSLGVGVSHTLNVAFDGINTKFKATYNNGTKAQLSRAGQLLLSINGVIQQPQETSAPTVGFGIDADSTIVFSVAPAVSDVVFGNIIANSIATFDISDNNVDNFTGNGSTLAFTLSKTPANNQNVLVTLDGVVQYPSDTTTTRAYSVTGSTLTFASAPANGVEIQVRHIGFAGATSSAVTGFYGRTGNAVLTSADDINVQNITGVAATFTGNVSIAGTLTYEDVTNVDSVGLITARSGIIVNTGTATTALVVNGNARVTGILTIGTSSITLDGSTDAIRIGSGVTITSSGIVATSGVTTVSAGSTAAPSITPTGDTNTGIFFPSADTIAFAEGGVEAARIDSSGRLGVGLENPSVKVHISDSVTSVGSTGTEVLRIANTRVNTGSGAVALRFVNNEISGTNQYTRAQIAAEYDGTSNNNGRLMFATTDTNGVLQERARIDGSGRLLIGTSSSPTVGDSQYSYLVVQGYPGGATGNANISLQRGEAAANITSGEQIGDINFTDSAGYPFAKISCLADANAGTNDYPGRLVFSTTADGAASPTERMRLDSSGRLGIGTNSPSARLHAIGDASSMPLVLDSSAANSNSIQFRVSTNVKGYIGPAGNLGGSDNDMGYRVESGNNQVFYIGANERARLDSSGRWLLGTSTAQGTSIFQAVGNSTASTDAGDIRIIRGLAVSNIGGNVGAGLGIIRFGALENTVCATIEAQSDATWSSTSDTPGRLVFSTTADGSSTPTERARITQQGFFKATNSNDYYGSTATYHESRTNAVGNVTHLFSHAGTSGNSYGIQISYAQNRGTQAGDQYIYCNDIAALRMEVRGNGGIANYQANNVNLSDRNVKKDITPASGTWNCIKEWEIVNYRYKDQPDDADLNLGVIAQQVAESCPEVITVFSEAKEAKPAVLDDDGNEVEAAQEAQPEKLGVKEQQMYWMAIKALQEAQVRIEQLEARLTAAGID